jgi:hypothetical protein
MIDDSKDNITSMRRRKNVQAEYYKNNTRTSACCYMTRNLIHPDDELMRRDSYVNKTHFLSANKPAVYVGDSADADPSTNRATTANEEVLPTWIHQELLDKATTRRNRMNTTRCNDNDVMSCYNTTVHPEIHHVFKSNSGDKIFTSFSTTLPPPPCQQHAEEKQHQQLQQTCQQEEYHIGKGAEGYSASNTIRSRGPQGRFCWNEESTKRNAYLCHDYCDRKDLPQHKDVTAVTKEFCENYKNQHDKMDFFSWSDAKS